MSIIVMYQDLNCLIMLVLGGLFYKMPPKQNFMGHFSFLCIERDSIGPFIGFSFVKLALSEF